MISIASTLLAIATFEVTAAAKEVGGQSSNKIINVLDYYTIDKFLSKKGPNIIKDIFLLRLQMTWNALSLGAELV